MTGPGQSNERPSLCPNCQQRALLLHCPAPDCPWHRCHNKACALLINLRRRRGLLPLGGGRYRPVQLAGG